MKRLPNYFYLLLPMVALALSASFVWWQRTQIETPLNAESSTQKTIASLEERYLNDPASIPIGIGLADAYLQEIRETADTALYSKIETILAELETSTQDPFAKSQIYAKRAEVANGRHHFRNGLEAITEAIALDPSIAAYYGIKSDSEVELGLYDESLASVQEMVDRKPNFGAYTRVAYQRELRGDINGAIEAMESAISAGSTYPENMAWAYNEKGKLELRNDLSTAERDFKQSLVLFPEFGPALVGLGKVEEQRNNNEEAGVYYTRAFAAAPIAYHATVLGKYYETMGDQTRAAQYFALADAAYKRTTDTDVSLEYAQFLSDHGDPALALELAEKAYLERPSIFAADGYAWAQYKNGNFVEAKKYSEEALRLGEFDPIILKHAMMIAEQTGDTAAAARYASKI